MNTKRDANFQTFIATIRTAMQKLYLIKPPSNERFSYTHLKEVRRMELKDTIELMQSEDYKERFKAEYYQLKIRLEKLYEMLVRYDAGTLGFTPDCSIQLLKDQLSIMRDYLYALQVRAEIENIEL